MTKKWLIEGFCETIGYQSLMPVEYESVEADGVVQYYKKRRMVCQGALQKTCPKEADCPFYMEAQEQMEKNANWYEG